MEINNVIGIYDDGESVTIVTATQTAIILPINTRSSITIKPNGTADYKLITVIVDLYQ